MLKIFFLIELPLGRLEKLLIKLKKVEDNRFETRAFVYLDIVSWLESKLENVPVQDVIKKKFKRKKVEEK